MLILAGVNLTLTIISMIKEGILIYKKVKNIMKRKLKKSSLFKNCFKTSDKVI